MRSARDAAPALDALEILACAVFDNPLVAAAFGTTADERM
jgi:hypothetical protein